MVAERSGDCVSVFSPSGEKLQSFCKRDSGPGWFDRPRGIAVDGEGNILVTDRHNHHIQKFSAEGRFLEAVGTRGSGPLQYSYPAHITYSTSNTKVYVLDSGNHRVQVLNSDLSFSSAFGEKGSGVGPFKELWGIACDDTGKVYVVDGSTSYPSLHSRREVLEDVWKV